MTRYIIEIQDYPNKEQYNRGLIYKQDLTRFVNTSSKFAIEYDTQLKEFIKQLERTNRRIEVTELY
jgi:hypothetical protein